MKLNFDWDESNRRHIAKHRATPVEAEQVVLNDPIDLEVQTEDGEERLIQLGETDKGRILVVITTWRGEKIRVITAFRAPKQLRDFYIQEYS